MVASFVLNRSQPKLVAGESSQLCTSAAIAAELQVKAVSIGPLTVAVALDAGFASSSAPADVQASRMNRASFHVASPSLAASPMPLIMMLGFELPTSPSPQSL